MKYATLLLTLILSSCIETGTNENLVFQEVSSIDPNDTVTFQQINNLIIQPFNCIQCHSDWANTEAGVRTKIMPGEPFESKFYLRLEDGSMPLGGPQIDKQRLEYVENYIRQLQINED